MERGINKPMLIGLAIFFTLAFALFGYILYQNYVGQEAVDSELLTEEPEEELVDTTRIVTAKHDYVDGKHLFAGAIDLPTPCHLLTHEVVFLEDNPANVEIQFTSQVTDPETMCGQVIQSAPFKVEFEAPEDAAISATLNGEGIVLNPVEVPEGEDLESFSEFYKG